MPASIRAGSRTARFGRPSTSPTGRRPPRRGTGRWLGATGLPRSEEHTSELQSRFDLVCRLLLEKKKASGLLLDLSPLSISPLHRATTAAAGSDHFCADVLP